MKKCLVCGSEIESKNVNTKTCSVQCSIIRTKSKDIFNGKSNKYKGLKIEEIYEIVKKTLQNK